MKNWFRFFKNLKMINSYLTYFPFIIFGLLIILWIGIFLNDKVGIVMIIISSGFMFLMFVIYFICLVYDTRRRKIMDELELFNQHAGVS